MNRYETQRQPYFDQDINNSRSYQTDRAVINNFQAIQHLKKTENELDIMKKRLSALKIREDKNNRKSQMALKKLKYHELIQQMQKKQRDRKQIHKAEVQLQIQRQKSINSSQRSFRIQKLKEVKEQFTSAKKQHYKRQKITADELESKLKQLVQNDSKEKKELKKIVDEHKINSRRNYNFFLMQKKRNSQAKQYGQSSRFIDMKEKKQLEMRSLMRMEIQMVERQSKSRESAQSNIRQLNKIITPHSIFQTSGKSNTERIKRPKVNPEYDF